MLLTLLPVLAALAVILLHLYTFLERRKYAHFPRLPLPVRWNWLAGHVPHILKYAKRFGYNSAGIFECIRREMDVDSYVFFFGPMRNFVYTVRLPVIARVMSEHKTFLKGTPRKSGLDYIAGNRVFGDKGILTEPGTEVWYHKRKMMDPAFQKKFLRVLMGDMNSSTAKFCQYLRDLPDQKNINIYEILNRVALEVVCTCGFNLKDDFITLEDSALNKAVTDTFAVIPVATFNFMEFWLPWKYREEKKMIKEASTLLRTTMKEHLQVRIDALRNGTDTTTNDILAHIIRGKTGKVFCNCFPIIIKFWKMVYLDTC